MLSSLFDDVVAENKILVYSSEISDYLVPRLKPKFVKPEDMIITQGDNTDDMQFFIIARGDAEVYVYDEKGKARQCNILHPGSHFGEVALITGSARSASVRAMKYITLGVLEKVDFFNLIQSYPSVSDNLRKHIYDYHDRYKRFKIRCLQRIPYLKILGNDAI